MNDRKKDLDDIAFYVLTYVVLLGSAVFLLTIMALFIKAL